MSSLDIERTRFSPAAGVKPFFGEEHRELIRRRWHEGKRTVYIKGMRFVLELKVFEREKIPDKIIVRRRDGALTPRAMLDL